LGVVPQSVQLNKRDAKPGKSGAARAE